MKEYKYKINGNPYQVSIDDAEDNIIQVNVNGVAYTVELEKQSPQKIKPIVRTPSTAPVAPPPAISRPTVSNGKLGVKSPLPGVILEIKVKEGDTVKRGQTVVILEAMKMENDIKSEYDGKIAHIQVNKGDSVLEGTDLIIIE